MPEIRDVKINEIGIPPVRSIFTGLPEPVVNQFPVPVTINIGTPIVNVPGCVEVNLDGTVNDSDGNVILCDGQVPSFNPIDYDPSQLKLSGPPIAEPEFEGIEMDTADIPLTPSTPKLPDIPIIEQNKKEKNIEETIEIVEEPTLVEQYLPSAEEVSTTVLIAGAAAVSAVMGKPLAELLLKLIKPAVKKIVQKIKNSIGVKKDVLSVAERRKLQRDLMK